MEIEEYSVSRDLDLYIEGDIEAFNESFPGMSVPGVMYSEIVNGLKALNNNEFTGAFTAVIDSVPVGFVTVSIQQFYLISQGYIESIFVHSEHRGKGISKALLNCAESWCRERGARSIKLDVSLVNENAISVYEASGYIKTRVQMDKPI